MDLLQRKQARLERIESKISNLEKEKDVIASEIGNIQAKVDEKKRHLPLLLRAGRVIERAGLLDDCMTGAFFQYLLDFKHRSDVYGNG